MFGAGRVGIKISPNLDYNDMKDSNFMATTEYLVEQLSRKNIAFLEMNEAVSFDPATAQEKSEKIWASHAKKTLRENFKSKFRGTFISNY